MSDVNFKQFLPEIIEIRHRRHPEYGSLASQNLLEEAGMTSV